MMEETVPQKKASPAATMLLASMMANPDMGMFDNPVGSAGNPLIFRRCGDVGGLTEEQYNERQMKRDYDPEVRRKRLQQKNLRDANKRIAELIPNQKWNRDSAQFNHLYVKMCQYLSRVTAVGATSEDAKVVHITDEMVFIAKELIYQGFARRNPGYYLCENIVHKDFNVMCPWIIPGFSITKLTHEYFMMTHWDRNDFFYEKILFRVLDECVRQVPELDELSKTDLGIPPLPAATPLPHRLQKLGWMDSLFTTPDKNGNMCHFGENMVIVLQGSGNSKDVGNVLAMIDYDTLRKDPNWFDHIGCVPMEFATVKRHSSNWNMLDRHPEQLLEVMDHTDYVEMVIALKYRMK